MLLLGLIILLLLSFNAFLIDGCFQAYYGIFRSYSLVKVVPISKRLYLFRLTFKDTVGFICIFGIFKAELKFIFWTTSYHQARQAFHLYLQVFSLFCHIDELVLLNCSWVARLVSGYLAKVLFVRFFLVKPLCKRQKG